jgi:hypothetical protein
MQSQPTAEFIFASPMSETLAMLMTTLSLVPLIGALSTLSQTSTTRFVSPPFFDFELFAHEYQVCGQLGRAEPVFDCLLQVTAYPQGTNAGTTHVETVVQTLLETQGEVFALLRQSESNDSAFRAVVEFSDTEVAVWVAHRFNGATVGVSYRISLLFGHL